MRIWQRIFLVTFSIVTIFLMIFGSYLAKERFYTDLEAEKQNMENIHQSMYSDLQYLLQEIRTSYMWAAIEDEEFSVCVQTLVEREKYALHGIKVYIADTNEWFINEKAQNMLEEVELLGETCLIRKRENEKYHMVMSSEEIILDRKLTSLVSCEVTHIYEEYQHQMKQIRETCILLSFVAGGMLLVSVYVLLRPMKQTQKVIHHIAEGNYTQRVSVKGSTELAELAEDVNRMVKEIENKMDEMSKMLENRRVFIGDMAHEMKTPLTAILGFADLLTIQTDMKEECRREYADCIYKEAKRLKEISTKLLDLVQYEGKEIALQSLRLGELLEHVIEVEKNVCVIKGVKIEAILCDCTIQGDTDLLMSLFYNLLDNAVKASDEGDKICLYTEVSDEVVKITVQDYGIGIPKEEIEKIMEPFYMIDKSRSRSYGGAGLGLALCKEIIRIHNGTLNVKSEENKGSIFSVMFPICENMEDVDEEI